ncbi:MAG TPA: Rid family hydrolase [Vicinamibacterales bacterium]|jgi:enamine deaminase RidA (YjgF/YER057c/UK114 family)|nr:Rid family hydrolase [Vicinamibacterales bacterium]
MKKNLLVIASAILMTYALPAYAQRGAGGAAGAAPATQINQTTSGAPADVMYYGSSRSAISNGVMIPANRATLMMSGVAPGRMTPAGDTKAQAESILKNIEGQLKDHGLTMKDVVYLRAYVVPDPAKDHKIDMMGWSAAYGEYFGTTDNPTKPARATIGVAQLVGADQLIEVEIIAAFPK